MSNNTQNAAMKLGTALGIYLLLHYFGGSFGRLVLYPVNLLVTFLHEFGHALGALLTGGGVAGIQINNDGSGYCKTFGGNRAIILMGGYLGSAILGNILLYLGIKKEVWSNYVLLFLAAIMVFTGIIWFNSIGSTLILLLFAVAFFLIATRTHFAPFLVIFLGAASVLFIIQDFNVGPSSDLTKYAEVMGILPTSFWMYTWLIIAILILVKNVRLIFRR